MGYLSQRKKEKRTDAALKVLITLLFLALFLSFWGDGKGFFFTLETYRFHYYIIGLAALVYCICRGFIFYAALLTLFVIMSFMNLARSSNILFNEQVKGKKEETILYVNSVKTSDYEKIFELAEKQKANFTAINTWPNYNYKKDSSYHEVKNMIFTKNNILREGIIRLSPQYSSYFIVSEVDGKEIILVSVDFSGINEKEAGLVLSNLADFVKKQDNPVVIFGDFGVPVWTSIAEEFLNETNLEVKNRIIFSVGKIRFNPFITPSINVLGYKNMGLNKIRFLPKSGSKKHPITFKISF